MSAAIFLDVDDLKLKRMAGRPSEEDLVSIAEPWRPWRAVAARIIWHYYLSENGAILE